MKAGPDDMAQAIPALGDAVKAIEWGELCAAAITLAPGTDFAPVLAQRPTGTCAVPHWGFVRSGALNIRYADGETETVRAGELYYMPAGHLVAVDEATAYVEFSPREQFTDLMTKLAAIVG